MYSKTTNDIEITVEPTFLDNHSAPEDHKYVWAYHVRIENRGQETVQLKGRSWRIVNAHGHVQLVHGSGVVGEEPILGPGDWYEYTSGAPLTTPSGLMQGSYQMITGKGDAFEAEVPAFSLDSPHDPVVTHGRFN